MKVIIRDTYEEMSRWAAEYIIDRINAHNASPAGEIRPFVLGLPTGSSPLGVYRELVAANREGR
ncbi:MAG: glucosamine-6-phosphate deaminase, partial [Clostridia bacterium]|nr:glucosamine-6-phosphate deaminase [Clostridia bacterium]